MSRGCSPRVALWCATVLVAVIGATGAPPASGATLPSGFEETTAISGLVQPTVVRFAPDGRVFVGEKSGLIKVFDGLADSTPTVFADLRTQVYNYWDRGLMGMEIDHDFDHHPYVYVTYAHDAPIGGTAPRWGNPGQTSDNCPDPPGGNSDGCVTSGRLSRLVASGDSMVSEEVLIEDWCEQFPSHSMGTVEQDGAGNLLVGGGDGASFSIIDYGQEGMPPNPCGDPPVGVGFPQSPPSAQGGALRSQDIRTRSDPTGLDGTIIRVDRDGNPVRFNPLHSDPKTDANEKRIVAYGLRNPFRFTIAPDGEVFLGDVGWGTWEEINRFKPGGGPFNFGWPCYEGSGRQPSYDATDLKLCEDLYATPGAVRAPFFRYRHSDQVVPGEGCGTGSSSITGLDFYDDGASFPGTYRDALFFADASRSCIWWMRAGADGKPDPSTVSTFAAGAVTPVHLEVGPDGALYYARLFGGAIQRIQYTAANQSPIAVAFAEPTAGPAPLTVQFDGSGSSDPDGDEISFAWDLDGDGEFDDSTSPTPSRIYTQQGVHTVSLRVSDGRQGVGTASVVIDVGNSFPTPTIVSPAAGTSWRVGEQIGFAGTATDAEDGTLPASALDWDLILHHCPSNCHQHPLASFNGVASGSFAAPDHEYPSHLELRLTATDSAGLQRSTSLQLDPRTVDLTLTTNQHPIALNLTLNGVTGPGPITTTLIEGSTNSVSAPSPQKKSGITYEWRAWSDGGFRSHTIRVWTTTTLTATFQKKVNLP